MTMITTTIMTTIMIIIEILPIIMFLFPCLYINIFQSITNCIDAGATVSVWNYIALQDTVCDVTIVLVERRCTGCTNKWSSLLETTYIYKELKRNYIMRNICVRDAPCWDQTPNVLNVSSTNCDCERVSASSAKL